MEMRKTTKNGKSGNWFNFGISLPINDDNKQFIAEYNRVISKARKHFGLTDNCSKSVILENIMDYFDNKEK